MTTPDEEFRTEVSRARDKLANDIMTFLETSRAEYGASAKRVLFANAQAVARSVEHLARVAQDGESPPPKRERERTVADDALGVAVKTGLRRIRKFIKDLEEEL